MKGNKLSRLLAICAALALVILLSSVSPAYAADRIKEALDNAAQWFLDIIVAGGVIVVLIGAFSFMTSGGDTQKVQKGQKWLIWGMIGVIVALLAKAIVNWTTAIVR